MHQTVNYYLGRRLGDGSTPTFFATGGAAGADDVDSITPEYPAGIEQDDILLLHVHLRDGLGSGQVDSITGGWTLVDGVTLFDDCTAALYWKRADGTETGTETVTFSERIDVVPARAVISAWRGCVSTGTPYEGATHNTQFTTTAHVGSAVTTTGTNRRVVTFFGISTRNTTGSPTNGWDENYESNTTAGNDASENCNSIEAASAGSVSAVTRTQLLSSNNISFTLALIPTDVE